MHVLLDLTPAKRLIDIGSRGDGDLFPGKRKRDRLDDGGAGVDPYEDVTSHRRDVAFAARAAEVMPPPTHAIKPPMNVFESNVVNGDRVRFAIDNGPTSDFADSDIPQSVRAAIGRREKVVIGVRPHAVRLGVGSDDARIVSNQWLGDQSHLAMEVAGKLMVAVSHAPIPAQVGERLRFGVSASDLHVFDASTSAALSHGLDAA